MDSKEIDILRDAADEIWEIATRIERSGFHAAAAYIKDASTRLHDIGRDSAQLNSSDPID